MVFIGEHDEGVVVGEELCEVPDEAGEGAPGVGPGFEVRTGCGAGGGVDEWVTIANLSGFTFRGGDKDHRRRERVGLVEPDGEGDGRRGGGDAEVANDAEEGDGSAVVVDECAEGGAEGGEFLEERKEVVSYDPFLVGVGVREVESGCVGVEEG